MDRKGWMSGTQPPSDGFPIRPFRGEPEPPNAWQHADDPDRTLERPALPSKRPDRSAHRIGLVAVVVGVIAILTLAVVVVINLGAPAREAPSAGAVRFLEAVAAGDADRALAEQVEVPADRTLLTDQVLTASLATAPISRIQVKQDSEDRVEISYLLGDREVTAVFTPALQSNGRYKVVRGTAVVDISRPRQIHVIVNGALLSRGQVPAFPGSYEVTTGVTHLEYAEPRFTVSGPESNPRLVPGPRLSPTGEAAFLAAARNQLEQCMRALEVNPPGCPQVLTVGDEVSVDSASVQWTLEGDPLAGVTPKLNLNDETVAEVRLSVRAHLRANVTTSSGPGVVNQTETFPTTATGAVAVDRISVRFVRS